MSDAKLPCYVEAYVGARQAHVDESISRLVTEAIRRREAELIDTIIAREVDTRLTPVAELLDAERRRVMELVEQQDRIDRQIVSPLRVERDALRAQVEELRAQLAEKQDSSGKCAATAAAQIAVSTEREELLTMRNAELVQQLDTTTQQMNVMTKTTAELHATIARLEEGLAASRSAAEDYVTQSASKLIAELRSTQTKLDLLGKERDDALCRVDELEGSLSSLKDAFGALEEKYSESEKHREEYKVRLETTLAALEQLDKRREGTAAVALLNVPPLDQANHSARAQLLDFWRDGHAEIFSLKSQLRRAEEAVHAMRKQAEVAVELQTNRDRLMKSITVLTAEVDALQEERRMMRATVAGVEQEAEALQRHLAIALRGELSMNEISECAAAFRDAAQHANHVEAAESDPAAVRQAVQQLQTLKHEIQQLEKRKRNNAAVIATQLDAITALKREECSRSVLAMKAVSPDVVGQLSVVLKSIGADAAVMVAEAEQKLRVAEQNQAALQQRLQAAESKNEQMEATWMAERSESERNRMRLESSLTHCRDEIRTLTCELGSRTARFSAQSTATQSQREGLDACIALCRVATDIALDSVSSMVKSQLALIEARADCEAIRRGQEAAIDAALDSLGDDAICSHLRTHLDLMGEELRRRQRKDTANESNERMTLVKELQMRSTALSESAQKIQMLGESLAVAEAAKAESSEWCHIVDQTLTELQRRAAEALSLTVSQGTVVGAEVAAAIQPRRVAPPATEQTKPTTALPVDTSSVLMRAQQLLHSSTAGA